MALKAGLRLGPYEILSLLGAGGMGEVYRATDTRLNRTVAIKVLPQAVALDPERRQRFEREARLVASLSHPHICAVHDVGSQAIPGAEPLSYLVMEYLEGETLAERLARGPLPLDETIRIGAGIAAALAAAHREQIVHRDLKPANVILTKSGLKLLDFGIAKAIQPVERAGGPMPSTKALTLATTPGTMPGTLPYMSPEQLEGRHIDARSDIFALGSVIFEMATGTRAFPGESYAALASSILTSTPPPIAASPSLDRIVRTCMAKDPDRRWQSAHDIALQLAAAGEREAAAGAPRPRRAVQWLPWAIACAAIVLAILAILAVQRARAVPAGAAQGAAVRFQVAPPDSSRFLYHVEHPGLAVSPDGLHVAFAAVGRGGGTGLWLRPLASLEAKLLEGTEGASSMFWSPDSRSIAFFSDGKLRRVEIGGGRPVPIGDARQAIGQAGTWAADGTILISSVQGEAILKIPASGGSFVEVMKPDLKRGELRVMWPSFLPDGRSFLFTITFADDSGAVMLKSPDVPAKELLRAKSNVHYVDPGYLLFVRDSSLIARRFDVATGALSGDPVAVASPVNYFSSTAIAQYSASRAGGVIALQSHPDQSRLITIDRSGKEVEVVREPGGYQSVRLSRDGRQLLFARTDPRAASLDVFLMEMARGAETQLTNHSGSEAYPLWGPGETIIYMAAAGGAPRLRRRALDSGAEERIGPEARGLQQPSDVSPDGQWLLYSQRTELGDYDLHALHLTTGKVTTLRDSPVSEMAGRFSPDGRYVAFVATEGGRSNVYLMPFGAPGARRAVSTAGGTLPRWSHDGRELFFVSLAQEGPHLAAASITFTPSLDIGKAVPLFPLPAERSWLDFAPARDGRFLAVQHVQSAGTKPMTIIANWPASLGR